MPISTKKKAGRPAVSPLRKSVKPNISVRRDLLDEAAKAAEKRGLGLSEYVTEALIRQVARDDIE